MSTNADSSVVLPRWPTDWSSDEYTDPCNKRVVLGSSYVIFTRKMILEVVIDINRPFDVCLFTTALVCSQIKL